MTTREEINIGSSANDGTGDGLRTAGTKINNNLGKIFNMLGPDSDHLSERISFDSDSLIYTGTTNTITVNFTDPASDDIVVIPDASGNVVLDSASQTLANKTIKNPIIQTSNGVDALLFDSDSDAVNEITVINAATGVNPTIKASGDDANVSVYLEGKGTGGVEINKGFVKSEVITANGAASTTVGYSICNKATALAVTLTNGSSPGELRMFTNKGAGVATVTPSSFAQGTSFALPQYASAQLIWDDSNWNLIGAFPDSDVTIT